MKFTETAGLVYYTSENALDALAIKRFAENLFGRGPEVAGKVWYAENPAPPELIQNLGTEAAGTFTAQLVVHASLAKSLPLDLE